ncbi:MAG: NFACT RNA binding domain-containing protein [Candidatus Paceibacterota bacterium]
MNNYYTLIYLTKEIKKNLNYAIFTAAHSVQKNRLDLFFKKNENPIKLSISVEPSKTALFQEYYTIPKIRNSAHFFENLKGAHINDISLAEGDRLLTMKFNINELLVFQLFTNKANVFHIKNNYICSSFKNQSRYNEKLAPKAHKPNTKNNEDLKGSARQKLIAINPLLPRNLFPDLVDYFSLELKSNEQLSVFAERLHLVLTQEAVPGVLADGRICLLPDNFFKIAGKKIFKNFNEAIRSSFYYQSHFEKFKSQINNIVRRLEKQQVKLQKRLKFLSEADKSLERSEHYEKYGHMIMANLYIPVNPEADEIHVEDLYNEGKKIIIPINKKLSLVDNANMYYDKSREAKTSYHTAGKLLKETGSNLEQVNNLLTEVRTIKALRELDKWEKTHHHELQRLGAYQAGEQIRQPYRKLEAGGYELWIGKNAKSNDELLRDSHKEDIWLHARGYPGSHIIIRMKKKIDLPEKHVLKEAAAYAAKYSKGASSSLIPVIYTKRKYVRKPKGAAAGQVKVIKEQVILVSAIKNH